ncbi:unnamed protein product, partial [Prorocentrum cordatum]
MFGFLEPAFWQPQRCCAATLDPRGRRGATPSTAPLAGGCPTSSTAFREGAAPEVHRKQNTLSNAPGPAPVGLQSSAGSTRGQPGPALPARL